MTETEMTEEIKLLNDKIDDLTLKIVALETTVKNMERTILNSFYAHSYENDS